ncbi:RICTOR family protein [Pleurotus pulmonarius]
MASLLKLPGTSPGVHSFISQTSTLVNPSPDVVDPTLARRSFSFDELEGLDESEQLEILHNQLSTEKSIIEGAEDFLNRDLPDSLRQPVQSELLAAKKKIDALSKRIAILQSLTVSDNNSNGSNALGTGPAASPSVNQALQNLAAHSTTKERVDVSRVALKQAKSCLSQLLTLELPSSPSFDSNAERIDKMQQIVSILQRHFRVRYELDISEVVKVVVPALADNHTTQCRAHAYRLMRYMLVDVESVQRIGQSLDWYIVKSLSRDNKYTIEKEQVIKLIRSIVEVGSIRRDSVGRRGSVPLSESVMRAVVAVAEYAEDPFRSICVQTLAEILLIDIDLVSKTGGIRFLLHALGDGPLELAPILASVFLHIADSPRTRAYLRLGSDLELALSAVTDAYGKPPDHITRIRGCIKIIQLMLRTWSGLMYFCMNDLMAIRSLVNTLRIPSLEARDVVLDMFFDLLNIKIPEWHKVFVDGRRLTRVDSFQTPSEPNTQPEVHERSNRLKLTDQYIGLLILIFNKAGLLDALTSILEESVTGSNLSRKATLLMAEMLQLSNRVLPLSVAAKFQTVSHIFDLASNYGQRENRIIGTLALSSIDSFNRNRSRLDPAMIKSARPRANSVDDAARRQRQIEQVKIKLGMQMDEKTFVAVLNESQIGSTKEHARWQFDVLIEVVEGPLRNPPRLEEAIKASRLIRRLMSFFHPRSHRFSDIPRTKSNMKWVRLGCALLTTLVTNPDGVRYLSTEDVFLQQIVWGFSQLDPFNGPPDSDPIFSKARVNDTLTYGYFEMLGTLSKHKEGIELLEKFKVFTAFYHLSELRSREDLIKGIIENLDYNIDGHPRIILSKALTSSYKHIRLYATRHLGDLIRVSSSVNAWTLRLLVTQLYDPAPEVCELAAHFLKDACESKEALQLVVEMQPMMDHLGDIGHPLLMRFTSTLMGFRYLYDTGYIDREMDIWYHERNIDYVVQVETELGCQVLQDKGHFADFAHFIRQHSHESEDSDLILKLKSILWAVGNIGATEGGLPFLEEQEVIPTILEIAEESPIPSVRGTCFFVLGLISSTSQGAEILDDYQWEATLSPLGLPTGLCIPVDLEKFISLPPWQEHAPEPCANRLNAPTSEAEVEVMTAIQNLANTVIANAASRSLTKMKSRAEYKHLFASPIMLYRALHTISTQRFRLPVRRYILELFNVELNSETAAAMEKCAEVLQTKSPSQPTIKEANRISIFGRLGRHDSESDDEEDDLDPRGKASTMVVGQPVINLRPVSKIIGFAL